MRLILDGRLSTSVLLKRIALASQQGYNEICADLIIEEQEQQQHRSQDNFDVEDDDDDNSIVSRSCSISSICSVQDDGGDGDDHDGEEDDNSIVCGSLVSQRTLCSSVLSTMTTSSWLVIDSETNDDPTSLSLAVAVAASRKEKITTVHLCHWDFDRIDNDVIVALQDYLEYETSFRDFDIGGGGGGDCHHCNDGDDDSSSSLSQLRHVVLEDCVGGECLQYFVVVLFETVAKRPDSTLAIQYNKQRKMPPSIANGLYQGATEHGAFHHNANAISGYGGGGRHRHPSSSSCCNNSITHGDCQLRSLCLVGMTLTPLTIRMLQVAIPLLRPHLTELKIRGASSTVVSSSSSVDGNGDGLDNTEKKKKQHVSIIGRYKPDMEQVVQGLHYILEKLSSSSSCLRTLDLQHCHLPDEYLADLLEALDPTTINTLKLNGNIIQEESQQMIHAILTHRGCTLKHLDVSSCQSQQQMLSSPPGPGYYYRNVVSILSLAEIAHAVSERNNSLETLDVSNNKLLDEDVTQLALAIRKSTSLQHVSMQNCHITDNGMRAIAAVIPHFGPQMKRLRIDGYQSIRHHKQVQRKMYNALLQNVYLHELTVPLSCNRSKSIDWILEMNRAGRCALNSFWDQPASLTMNKKGRNNDDQKGLSADSNVSGTDSNKGMSLPNLKAAPGNKVTTSFCDSFKPIPNNLWPIILARADRVSRQNCDIRRDLNDNNGSSCLMSSSFSPEDPALKIKDRKAASTIYLLLREKGYESCMKDLYHEGDNDCGVRVEDEITTNNINPKPTTTSTLSLSSPTLNSRNKNIFRKTTPAA
jgi:Leucine Rich repeat